MALTKSDLNQIGNLIDKANTKQDKRWDKKLDKKLTAQRRAINGDIADFINTAIVPKLDDISDTLNSIQRVQENHDERLFEHSDRIEKLEKIHPGTTHPVV